MTKISNQKIFEWNNGKIVPGDYVVFSGTDVPIVYNTNNVDLVNIVLEKDGLDVEGYLNGSNPIRCSNDGQPNTFLWRCNINVNPDELYPKYRIKIVSVRPENVIGYSNYFKISAYNEQQTLQTEL